MHDETPLLGKLIIRLINLNVLSVDRWMDVWKSMSVSMSLEPPFQPGTLIEAIIFVVNTEAFNASCQILLSLGHHVDMVF